MTSAKINSDLIILCKNYSRYILVKQPREPREILCVYMYGCVYTIRLYLCLQPELMITHNYVYHPAMPYCYATPIYNHSQHQYIP